MNYGFSTMARAGAFALALVTGASGMSYAAPYGAFATHPAQADVSGGTAAGLVQKVDGRGRNWRRHGNRDRGNWDRGDFRRGGWRGDRGWRDGDRWRYGRRHRDYYGSAAVLGLGLGLLAAPTYNYYSAPRRVYRQVGNSHVQWCYNRYRSYRASDNTFQPYNSGRQQCYSPYS